MNTKRLIENILKEYSTTIGGGKIPPTINTPELGGQDDSNMFKYNFVYDDKFVVKVIQKRMGNFVEIKKHDVESVINNYILENEEIKAYLSVRYRKGVLVDNNSYYEYIVDGYLNSKTLNETDVILNIRNLIQYELYESNIVGVKFDGKPYLEKNNDSIQLQEMRLYRECGNIKFINKLLNESTPEYIPRDPLPVNKIKSDKLRGGLADNWSLSDIANYHDMDVEELRQQAQKGIKVEMEHTDDKFTALEITKDHLIEDPYYYNRDLP